VVGELCYPSEQPIGPFGDGTVAVPGPTLDVAAPLRTCQASLARAAQMDPTWREQITQIAALPGCETWLRQQAVLPPSPAESARPILRGW